MKGKTNMKYIYKVKCHYVWYYSEVIYSSSDLKRYCYTDEIGIFSSLRNAEDFIRSYHKIFKGDKIIGFNIEMIPIDSKEICHFSSLYSYDSFGNRLCASEYDEICNIRFKGRTEDVHFKPDDIVLCVENDNIVSPVKIVDIPIVKCENGDYSDDCYSVLKIGYGHFHPHVTSLFPIIGEVDNRIKDKLQKQLEKYNLNGF